MADLDPMYGSQDPRLTRVIDQETRWAKWTNWKAHRYVLRHCPDDGVMAMLFDPVGELDHLHFDGTGDRRNR